MNEMIDELQQRQKHIKELGFDLPEKAHATLNRLNNLIYAREVELEDLVYSRDKLVKGINAYLA